MYSRKCAMLGASLVVIAVGNSFAEEAQVDELLASHLDWTGSFSQVETRDGSLLNEYIAQTDSTQDGEARLIVSMMPRFSCVPMISTVVSDPQITDRVSDINLQITVDEETFDFPSVVDWEKALRRFSLNSEQARHERLRQALDEANQATFEWSINPGSDSGTEAENDLPRSGEFDFSLLGSRKTVQDMQDLCTQHTPIPFNN